MDNTKFYLRVAYTIILFTLTFCYIFGDVIQSWWSWFSGVAYGLAMNELAWSFKRQEKNSRSNKTFWLRLAYIFILVTLTLCYIFGDVIQSWWNWFSGLAYGVAISGLMGTFDRRIKRR